MVIILGEGKWGDGVGRVHEDFSNIVVIYVYVIYVYICI